MSVTIKTSKLAVKNPVTGNFDGLNIVGDTTTADMINRLNIEANNIKESFPSDYSHLVSTDVDHPQNFQSAQKAQARNNIDAVGIDEVQKIQDVLNTSINNQISFVETAQDLQSQYYKSITPLSTSKSYLIRLTVAEAGSYALRLGTNTSLEYMVDTLGPVTVQANVPYDFVGYVPSQSNFTKLRLSAAKTSTVDIYEIINIDKLASDVVHYNAADNKTDAEKVQARENIGAASDVEASDLVSNLNAETSRIGLNIITGWQSGYINVGTSTNISEAIANPTPSANWQYIVLACTAGDVFTVNVQNGTQPRGYTFTDSEYNVLKVANPSGPYVITAPLTSAWLVLSRNVQAHPYTESYYGQNQVAQNTNRIIGLNSILGVEVLSGWVKDSYISIGNSTNIANEVAHPSLSNNWQYIIVKCSAGDIFTINANSGQNPKAFTFVDNAYNVLLKGIETSYENERISAPSNAAFLILQKSSTNTKESYRESIGDTVYTKLFNEFTECVSDALEQKQPIEYANKITIMGGLMPNGNGYDTSAILENYKRSNYIPVLPGTKVYYDGLSAGKALAVLAVYDSNKKTVSTVLGTGTGETITGVITVGQEGRYIRACSTNATLSTLTLSAELDVAPSSNTYNIWPANSSYTFTKNKCITNLNIPIGQYVFSAKITSSDTDDTKNIIVFRSAGTALFSTTIDRDIQVYVPLELTSACDEVRLFASSTSALSEGDTATFDNIMLINGSDNKAYIPPITAIDYVARNENYMPELLDVLDKMLADTTYWAAGSILDTGVDRSQLNSIRTNKYIKVDPTKKLYFQAYYTMPNSLVDVNTTDNYNIRNAYIAQYGKDMTFITRVTLTQAETIEGKEISLNSSCAYIRISLYTRYENTDMETIMPGTIFIDQVDDNYWLPPYYNTYLASKAYAIETYARAAGSEGNVFIFITDEHAPNYNSMRSPAIIKKLSEMVHIPILFNGGDVSHTGLDTWEYCDALRSAYKGQIYHLVGNQDFLNTNTDENLYYDMDMYNTNQIGNMERHYYYVDDPQRKTRYIVLAAYMESEIAEGTDSGTDVRDGYTNEQKTWLSDTALNLPTDWNAIVFTHALNKIDPTTNRTSYVSNAASSFEYILAMNPAVIGVFQGHAHKDRVIQLITRDAGNMPVIITTCDKNKKDTTIEEGWSVNRASGTIYEQAFDVAIVNKKTKTINLVRVGGLAEDGVNDSPGQQVEERTITFRG